ncbi:hypothetical protein DU506_00135 [Vreelandella rituensis]|uniref:Uncharacterized protein n=1 Tax=Vreelandella rituensis TaxID=2282306 RepID=A0A368UAR2_9GAMM|nr:hypothetical protein DU506_00135 [Halomonas rituensis]
MLKKSKRNNEYNAELDELLKKYNKRSRRAEGIFNAASILWVVCLTAIASISFFAMSVPGHYFEKNVGIDKRGQVPNIYECKGIEDSASLSKVACIMELTSSLENFHEHAMAMNVVYDVLKISRVGEPAYKASCTAYMTLYNRTLLSLMNMDDIKNVIASEKAANTINGVFGKPESQLMNDYLFDWFVLTKRAQNITDRAMFCDGSGSGLNIA